MKVDREKEFVCTPAKLKSSFSKLDLSYLKIEKDEIIILRVIILKKNLISTNVII